MADWKQITARIRRARSSKDPAGQLGNLFTKTRDAMVAYELARYFESTGNSADAGKWYLTAAERFRRADWKTKAQESASRLGASITAETAEAAVAAADSPPPTTLPPGGSVESSSAISEVDEAEFVPASSEEASAAVLTTRAESPAPREARGNRRRRGRRGRDQHPAGRRRDASPARKSAEPGIEPGAVPSAASSVSEDRSAPTSAEHEKSESPAKNLRGRFGDPGLSSRLSQLEMSFRRLLSCPPQKLEDASHAPAGPGVWLLSDSDSTTYFYVESCQTLRIAIPNLLRGSARQGDPIRPRLAEHLGIPESRVGKYLSEHCVVRWLQMDEDAAHFAHFLVAVLRPALNA